jgi:hypothetical protein
MAKTRVLMNMPALGDEEEFIRRAGNMWIGGLRRDSGITVLQGHGGLPQTRIVIKYEVRSIGTP